MRTLLFVVNPASGGRAGFGLMARLRQQVDPERVIPLAEADLPALARLLAERADRAALVACGGDGTAAAVIEASWLANPLKPVPVGTIPLGTGNDLARHLGWRPRLGLSTSSHLDQQIHALQIAPLAALDRWAVIGPEFNHSFYNYLSIGLDARIAARFHALRNQQPWMFRNPLINKALYGVTALGEPALPVTEVLTLDERPDLPTWTRSLVLCNIASYAGGTCLAPRIRADDGWLDGFALGHGGALGLAVSGLRKPQPILRGAMIPFTVHVPLVAQCDGEPIRLLPGRYTIAHGGRARVITSV